jgi:UDP-glucose 4-epimerase
MAICLVTGGAGFIGSHLAEALLADGHVVRVFDNLCTGSLDNLQPVANRVDFIRGDVKDFDAVRKAVRGADWIFHQAALTSVPRSLEDPLATHHACATGTLHVLIAARDNKVRRVVYAGSSSVYGDTPTLPRRETDPVLPVSPYATAKLAGEHYSVAFGRVANLETVRLRYFNVFGPRQSPDSPYAAVIPRFIRAMQSGRRPEVYGDGYQSRDFTYVENVVQANLLAARAANTVVGKVYNIGCGRQTTLLELVARINARLGTKLEPSFRPPRLGEVRSSEADISRAREELGYCPSVNWEDGLDRCLQYYAVHHIAME